jgi:putative FmdB family regulatory protein
MPIFEYQCDSCESRFEELVLRAHAAAPICPDCSSDSVHKLHSSFAAKSSSGAPACESGFSESPAAGLCGTCGVPGPCAVN